jgi:uncharacterized protein (TIGR02646 family)
MRQVARPALPHPVQAYLDRRQSAAGRLAAQGALDIGREWKVARQTQKIGTVLKTLQQMMGARERCMYCVDSHGSDVEHFWPKAHYQQHAFQWSNMLLCCTECGRFKGDRFPMENGRPMLIDPTAEDPWQHLDFDPDTGNLTARFDLQAGDWSARGVKTVEVLQLDRREAMAAGYVRTFRHLGSIVQKFLAPAVEGSMTATGLLAELREADEHGLLSWCLRGAGQSIQPFDTLRTQCPQIWADCLAATQGPG